jgi:hypothetical protein
MVCKIRNESKSLRTSIGTEPDVLDCRPYEQSAAKNNATEKNSQWNKIKYIEITAKYCRYFETLL